jgi:hypothetical protein
MSYCCTTPLPASGTGNITNNPCFADAAHGDYSLRCSSPCIDAGTNSTQTVDINGNARCVDGDFDGGAVTDIGAYEYHPELTDSDGDRACDYNEYVAGTSMTDAEDCLIIHFYGGEFGFELGFSAVDGRDYTIQVCTNLVEGSWDDISTFSDCRSGETGGVYNYAYTPKAYYRVKVKLSE